MRPVCARSAPAARTSDPLLEAVRALTARVAALERRLEADDRAWLVALAEAVGALEFTLEELSAPALRRTSPRLRALLRGRSRREVGAICRRLRDRVIDGLVLRRGQTKRTRAGVTWRVYHVDDIHLDPCQAPAPGAE